MQEEHQLIELVPNFGEIGILLSFCLAALVVVGFRRVKARDKERPYITQLVSDLNQVGFFDLIVDKRGKLDVYRILQKVPVLIRTTTQELSQDRLSNGTLSKSLGKLHRDIEAILYHPNVAHMLHDTEEMKLDCVGIDKLTDLHKSFRTLIRRYDSNLLRPFGD
ncbi:hypothetical protein [Chryseolinea soli]|uniref:Uncharacterized protein n=1 Tax=Chryseolinea soli TaxID=2321403 RepID=A0A385SLC2_9BACT|nr:hypothetical protein [Chryseolinea soli]AYB32049.1 hypothetical protein D4L85_16385 [Chryseolinea soli]